MSRMGHTIVKVYMYGHIQSSNGYIIDLRASISANIKTNKVSAVLCFFSTVNSFSVEHKFKRREAQLQASIKTSTDPGVVHCGSTD